MTPRTVHAFTVGRKPRCRNHAGATVGSVETPSSARRGRKLGDDAYVERTETTGDLPLYDPHAWEQALEAGRFGR